MNVTYQRGFADPEIHGVTYIAAAAIDFDDGAYVGLSFGQGEEFAVRPECQIFGGPEMKEKFNRLAAAVNEIFGAPIVEGAPHHAQTAQLRGETVEIDQFIDRKPR